MAQDGDVIGDLHVTPAAHSGVTRLLSADLGAALERFNDPELLAEGKVNAIALDAIVERLGPRWAARRDQVYAHVEKTLERHLGLQGYHLRVSETDFLICQPDLGKFSGQAACLRYLREILDHFLGGEARLADEGVHAVSVISEGQVAAQRIDARHAEAAEHHEAAEQRSFAPEAPRTMDQWSPFVASDGRQVRVSCALEPVFELKGFGRIGFRMARKVLVMETGEELTPSQLANLSRADILRVDLATIARGLDRLRAEGGDERLPSLIIPVSYSSLSSLRGRAQIVTAFKEASSLVQRGVICEVLDIEGVPQGALLAATSLMRPFSLFVVGRLAVTPPATATLRELKGAGLQAISVQCPRNQSEAEFFNWSRVTVEAAKRIARSVLVYQTPSARNAGLCGLMGATHASVAPS